MVIWGGGRWSPFFLLVANRRSERGLIQPFTLQAKPLLSIKKQGQALLLNHSNVTCLTSICRLR